MRIRKNAKISRQLLYASSSLVINQQPPHIVCQLNQSPWDVIMDLSPPSSPPPPPPLSQVVVVVNKTDASGIDGSSMAVFEREEFNVVDTATKWESEDGGSKAEQQPLTILCCITDGRSWQCLKEAAAGSSMCAHHLSLTRSYSSSSRTHPVASKKHNIAEVAVETTPIPTPRRTQPRPNKASGSSNPYEFYYYSGFGPRWGKKRGGVISHDNNGSEEIAKNHVEDKQEMDNQRSTLLSQNNMIIGDDFDYVEYEDYKEDEEEEINGKKRARKPIKARSLKSLM